MPTNELIINFLSVSIRSREEKVLDEAQASPENNTKNGTAVAFFRGYNESP